MAFFQHCMHKTHKALANIDTNGHPRTHTTTLNTSENRRHARAKTKLSHRNRVMRVQRLLKRAKVPGRSNKWVRNSRRSTKKGENKQNNPRSWFSRPGALQLQITTCQPYKINKTLIGCGKNGLEITRSVRMTSHDSENAQNHTLGNPSFNTGAANSQWAHSHELDGK